MGWATYLWSIGSADVGVVAAGAALTLRMSGMSHWIMWALTTLFREMGVIREGMETISAPIELVDAPGAQESFPCHSAADYRHKFHSLG